MRTTTKGRRIVLLGGLLMLLAAGVTLKVIWRDLVIWYRLRPDFDLHRWRNSKGYPEYRHVKTGIVFVHLPGGTFSMGSPDRKPMPPRTSAFEGRSTALLVGSRDKERPRHTVSLGPFLIARHEVSQAEWRRVTGRSPSRFRGDDLPVESVSWNDCQEFCRETGLKLPTEAQWEYACRAGTLTAYAFDDGITRVDANFDENVWDDDAGQTTRVDAYRPNGFGLYNLHGNVWEWCEDVYDTDFYSRPEASGPDPVCTPTVMNSPVVRAIGPSGGKPKRVARGGGFDSQDWDCRSAQRGWGDPSDRDSNTGFRPVFPMR